MSETVTDVVNIDVCTDCIMVLANGELTDAHGNDIAAEHAQRIADRTPDGADVVPAGGEDDSEPWFSWSDCDGCGSPLGGDRHHAAYIYVTR